MVGERKPVGIQGTRDLRGDAGGNSGNAVLKIIAWVLGVSILVTLMSIGSCAYFEYRARKDVLKLPNASGFARTGGSASAGSVEAHAACSLVSNVEVGEALGTTVSSVNKGTSICQYTSSVGRSLKLEVTPQAGSLALKLSAMAMKGTTKGESAVRPVFGIGDEAYAGRKGSTLMFRKGNTVVNLDVHTDGNGFQVVQVIARKIATRLP